MRHWVTRVLILGYISGLTAFAAPDPTIEFNRDIRPILSDRCYTCHGPDRIKRISNLRLDTEAGAKADLGGRAAVIPGDPDKSEIIRRISTQDKVRRMPPASSGGVKLSDAEITVLTRWVAQGAKWQKHWSLIPPTVPALPSVADSKWVRNPIDTFVLSRLESESLKPSAEVERPGLIRRVALDLTGLPPTPAEVTSFVQDNSPNAYEKVVDRYLASPRYGERMAIRWLDAARYADTNGYQTDGERSMWRWRDWVINAFNRNMPFDQFTLEQLAGDMLPNATRPQIIATGFNRNHRGNGEGGIIPEEYAVEYVVDRVETTSAVWLGLTLGCARCHDHKYDPFTQKEFYQLFAYFNNIPESGKAFKYGNSPPLIQAPSDQQSEQLRLLDQKIKNANQILIDLEPTISKAQRKWEKSLAQTAGIDWEETRRLVLSVPFNGNTHGEFHTDPPKAEKYMTLMENGPVVTSRIPSSGTDLVWNAGNAEYKPGQFDQAAAFDGARYLEVGNIADFGFYDAFSLSAWIRPEAATGAIVSRAQDEVDGQGYGLYLKDGHLQANLVQRWLDDGARVESEAAVELNRWSHVAMTYDGSRSAKGIRIYLNGQPLKLKIHLDDLNQNFGTKHPFRIGAGLGSQNRFRGLLDEVRVYRTALTADQAAVLAVSQSIPVLARIAPEQRTPPQANKLRLAFLHQTAPELARKTWEDVRSSQEAREALVASFPTVMVMQESPTPRETHLLLRGAYDRPGPQVFPGVPSLLPSLPVNVSNNRLGFAKWILDPANPLPARVTVNRFWQMYFGVGLVKTVEDFGSQGEPPTNPALLDWLATEFVRTGWDIKALQKTIVMSATYRQSSKITPESLQKDPENRLLSRGPRTRLSPEMIRDQALAISGLLVEKIGGPSVKPYQPAGLWKELAGGEDYKADKGEGLYRRSLYTYWKRTSPPPMMMNFDSSGREACTVRELRTNTPLQSLNLMNDVTYLEAARAIGEKMMREGGTDPGDRIALAFRLAAARGPKPKERELLLNSFRYYLHLFDENPAAALKYLQQGETSRDKNLDPTQLAAYATVASLILNLDVTITKE